MPREIHIAPPLAALTAAVLLIGACDRRPETAPASAPAAAPVAAPREVLAPALPPPPVSRAQLLEAIAAARAAYAAGQADAGAPLAGRRFAIRQAFGCPGASQTAAQPGVPRWTRGPDGRTIELTLTPADWARTAVLSADETAWEAVEGYWLTRPWLPTERCPALEAAVAKEDGKAAPSGPQAAAVPTPLISGLAAVFPAGSSRVGRREGRAFALTLRGDPPPAAPTEGYRLVVEGRFTTFSNGRAIRCHSPSLDQAPVCVAGAEVDRIAFEDAEGKLLKEWRLG